MFVEAVLTRDDLKALLSEALPLTIHIGDRQANHSVAFHDLEEVTLVPDVGLRVTCKGRFHWPVLGVDLPVVFRSVTFLILPETKPGPQGDVLAFRFSVEHADLAGIPAAFDGEIADVINKQLQEHLALSWDFSKTLGLVVPMPAMLEPLESLATRAAWGKLKITEDAIVVAISLHAAFVRSGSAVRSVMPLVTRDDGDAPPDGANGSHGPLPVTPLLAAGVFGLAAGAGYLGLRTALRGR